MIRIAHNKYIAHGNFYTGTTDHKLRLLKKGEAGGSQSFIPNNEELEFYKNMPTVWDETKVLEGKIGEFATLVRKSANDWFLGSLTGKQGKKIEIKLNSFEVNSNYYL